ncbi:coth protein-domain-containing protein [Zychaea mexicana]|uniref:coth protein-domain-containing protein n=1 Tax=Zychaea mexicana TaxID=64656 RepID=UPI0022FEC2AC|nr:coth protein-domain-containing protein [Zychaea mexicana]KAI9491175.1 coth protein-domain-containing protein [Zychaea mexicana]
MPQHTPDTTYNVICAPGSSDKSVAVVIDGQRYPLKPSPSSSILFTGNAPSSQNYHYAITDGQGDILEEETFTRALQEGSGSNTPNEFYNRTWTTKSVRQLPAVYPPHKTFPSELHPTDEIPTFHFQAQQSEIDNMHKNVNDDLTVFGTMTYIRRDGVQTFSTVKAKISGRNARRYEKLSYNINLNGKGENLYGCSRFKLRALGTTDPAYIREDLAYKTLVSMGVPTTGASFARVFFNGQPMGLYTMIEHFKPSWLRMVFGDGTKKYKHGILYQGHKRTPASDLAGHYSDLEYYENNITAYDDGQYLIKEEPSGGQKLGYQPLMDLTKILQESNTEDWDSQLDMEVFMRFMVHEFFAGLSDNFIINYNNYFLYQDPSQKNRFTFINADLNRALGNTIYSMAHMLKGDFSSFVLEKEGIAESHAPPPMVKLMKSPKHSDRIKELIRELNDKLFSPAVLNPTIDDIVALIEDDVQWDQELPKPGKLKMSGKRKPGQEVNMRNTDEAYDTWVVARDGIPFKKAVNGPVEDHPSTIGVKEWIEKKNKAVASVN